MATLTENEIAVLRSRRENLISQGQTLQARLWAYQTRFAEINQKLTEAGALTEDERRTTWSDYMC